MRRIAFTSRPTRSFFVIPFFVILLLFPALQVLPSPFSSLSSSSSSSFPVVFVLGDPSPSSSPPAAGSSFPPTYCPVSHNVAYTCNCHDCCDACNVCSCSVRSSSASICPLGECGSTGCWCSPFCSCCRDPPPPGRTGTGDCVAPCNCRVCCDQCTRNECRQWFTYQVLNIVPNHGKVSGGTSITLQGSTFSSSIATHALCRFALVSSTSSSSPVTVPAFYLTPTTMQCDSPPAPLPTSGDRAAVVTVELSLDDGQSWTNNGIEFRYRSCDSNAPVDQQCNGHGRCSDSGECVCEAGWHEEDCECRTGFTGENCAQLCPGTTTAPSPAGVPITLVCSGHGSCHSSLSGAAICSCDRGHWSSDCSRQCPFTSRGECDGHGKCSDSGKCTCGPGWFGHTCDRECNGGSGNPCSGRGMCDADYGLCVCRHGYFGPSCEFECPNGAQHPCGGEERGTCDRAGRCSCNPGFRGLQCEQRVCPFDCYLHGDCINGFCSCYGGWTGQFCAGADPLIHPYANLSLAIEHGLVGFASSLSSSIMVEEHARFVRIPISRKGGKEGRITASVHTAPITAQSGVDFVKIESLTLVWEDQDNRDKEVVLQIIQDTISEGDETLRILIDSVTGGATKQEDKSSLEVRIAANEYDIDIRGQRAEVTLRVLIGYNTLMEGEGENGDAIASTLVREEWEQAFLSDVASLLSIPVDRIQIASISPDSDGSLVVLFILSSKDPDAKHPLELAHLLVFMIGNQESQLWQKQGTGGTKDIDIRFMPYILTNEDTTVKNEDGTIKITTLLSLLVPLFVICIIACFALFAYRKPVSTWLLWKLARFRFVPLQSADANDGEADEQQSLASLADRERKWRESAMEAMGKKEGRGRNGHQLESVVEMEEQSRGIERSSGINKAGHGNDKSSDSRRGSLSRLFGRKNSVEPNLPSLFSSLPSSFNGVRDNLVHFPRATFGDHGGRRQRASSDSIQVEPLQLAQEQAIQRAHASDISLSSLSAAPAAAPPPIPVPTIVPQMQVTYEFDNSQPSAEEEQEQEDEERRRELYAVQAAGIQDENSPSPVVQVPMRVQVPVQASLPAPLPAMSLRTGQVQSRSLNNSASGGASSLHHPLQSQGHGSVPSSSSSLSHSSSFERDVAIRRSPRVSSKLLPEMAEGDGDGAVLIRETERGNGGF